jgi:ribosomal-protein-alanine N-acetyltransferase
MIESTHFYLDPISPGILRKLFAEKSKEELLNYFALEESTFDVYENMIQKGMETHRYSLFFFLLKDKETHKTIGDCGFHTWNPTHRRAEIFYTLRNDQYKQKGLMSEALAHVLRYGFEEMNLHRIEAKVGRNNIPSQKLLHKFGFMYEGTCREDYVVDGVSVDSDSFALLVQDWKTGLQPKARHYATAQLAKHLREVYFGGNWSVTHLKEVLNRISLKEATTIIGSNNSILSLCYHINYFLEVAEKVLRDGALEGKDSESFSHPKVPSQTEWEAFVNGLFSRAESFADAIEKLSPWKLEEEFTHPKYGNYYRNILGIIEHIHYHLGQIVILHSLVQTEKKNKLIV